jgi:tetratricopeptide (TPR) repeat protein/predicted Ser/Thr protein kinase
MSLFLEAIELEPARRARWMEDACGGDEGLRRMVEEMIAADGEQGVLDTPAVAALEVDEPSPERVGPFRILGVLGRGGMGVVYEAEQDTPRRRVAVKLLRPGTLSRSLTARFRYEAELLGRLQHPGIAQVYAAGAEESEGISRPWIAMELVRGVRLDEHARGLTLPERLELLARVADAVHHAHQRGVIHRDLKCANVLVEPTGEPKVLDFGVARAEGADLRASLRTIPGQIVGTLQTMSPEQAMASADLDARTDVYSLGVMAYELLAGRSPLELEDLPLHAALQRVIRDEPPLLGTLDRTLAGDVQVVVAKALEKDRERRYASAAAFAADLRRIQAREPVEARPPSSVYLLSKLARRHLGLAVGGGLAALAALVGLTAFALQARATARAEVRAADEARAVAAIDGFLIQDLLAAPDPRVRGRDVRVLDVLDGAAAKAGEVFAESPELLARVRATLGKSYLALDELPLAEQNLRAALAWFREHRGEGDPLTLETEGTLIEFLIARQDTDEVLPLARASLARQRAVFGPDHRTTLTTATNLATAIFRSGELAESEALLRDVIARRERTLGADDTATLLARENLATVLVIGGRQDEALREREAALALRRARYGERDPGTLIARLYLAQHHLGMSMLTDPVPTFETLLEETRAVFGERHRLTGDALLGLGAALERAGRPEDALDACEQAIELFTAVLGASHESTLEARIQTTQLLQRLGMIDESVAMAEECLADRERGTGDPISLGRTRLLAGETRLTAGDRERAAEHLRAALEALEDAHAPIAESFRARARAALARAESAAGD